MTIYYHSVFCDNLLLVCILILSIYFIICCWYLLRNVLLEWQNMLNVRRHDNWQLMGPIHYLLIIFTFHIKIIFNTCYLSCKFNSNPWQVLLEKKLNVIKIASDMWWVGCFLLVLQNYDPIKLTSVIELKYNCPTLVKPSHQRPSLLSE